MVEKNFTNKSYLEKLGIWLGIIFMYKIHIDSAMTIKLVG